ncbi:MAG: phospholipase [Ruminococcaceae bacterium]|nr:phospholipase [Oscillospiraceae bacterium]
MECLNFEGLQYLVRYPAGYEKGNRYPVILFLHGAGTRGNDIGVLEQNAFFVVTDEHAEFPFISVAPHCASGTWFDCFERLQAFVRMIADAAFTDRDRLYLVGNSMGGYGAWQLAMSMPTYFAAVVPICGGGMYWNTGTLTELPIWAFHGEDDHVVFAEESKKMVNGVNQKGGHARLTIYPDTKHNAWTPTYRNYEVFRWLLSQHRRAATGQGEDFADEKRFG